jgi:ERCC4-type nuclease
MLIIDSNEYAHDPKVWEPIVDKVDNLDIDFLVQGEVANFAVERKEFKDLKASLTGDERLWQQVSCLRQLRDQGYTPFVACIGSRTAYDVFQKHMVEIMTEEQFVGIQIGIARNRVNFIHFVNDKGFHAFLANLNERSGTAREYQRPTIHKPERTIDEERSDLYCAIKGIGRKKGDFLAKEVGSPVNVINSLRSGVEPELYKKLMGKNEAHFREVMGCDK